MNKYIDAEKLIAEIEELKSVYSSKKRVIHGIADGFRQDGMAAMCDIILTKITSLQQEQPEVDLEEFDKDVAKLWGRCAAEPNDSIACLHIETFNEVARHFYELGLNARKEEC